jgi:hypothetical protein
LGSTARDGDALEGSLVDGATADGATQPARDGVQSGPRGGSVAVAIPQGASNQKISDDEIKAVLEDVRRQLQRAVVAT